MRDYKPYVAIAITALLASFTFSACTPITTIDQAADSAGKGDSTSTEASDHPNTITPAFFSEMGKTLGELREEYPEGITVVSLDGFPDCAARSRVGISLLLFWNTERRCGKGYERI